MADKTKKQRSEESTFAVTQEEQLLLFTKFLEKQGDYRIRMSEPVPYNGARDALVVDGWVRSVERFAAFHEWDDAKTCRFAVTLFRDRADAWYRTMEATDKLDTSWLELKRDLIAFFRPDNSIKIARDKLCNLKQTSDIVSYINEFMDLKLALPGMNEEEATDKFIRGLSLSRMMWIPFKKRSDQHYRLTQLIGTTTATINHNDDKDNTLMTQWISM